MAAASAYLESRGFRVAHRADENPDDDMIFMCGARRFVLAGGGYSRLAAECALAYDDDAPAAVFGLAPPATVTVRLPTADRRARDARIAEEKRAKRAKRARSADAQPTANGS